MAIKRKSEMAALCGPAIATFRWSLDELSAHLVHWAIVHCLEKGTHQRPDIQVIASSEEIMLLGENLTQNLTRNVGLSHLDKV